jgi:hypothetical protein
MRTSVPFVLAGLLVACGNPNTTKQPPQDTATAKQAPATNDGAQPAPPPDDAPLKDPAVVRRERAEEALTRIPSIKEDLVAMRQLEFKTDVPAQYQEQSDFQRFVGEEVAKAITPEKAEAIQSSMFHIGLLATQIDLAKTLTDAMVSQAAAYYDPKQKKFFVVVVPNAATALDAFSMHELTHALQDQHFDLENYLEPGGKMLDDDAANARKFVVEGEATFTMMVYAMKTMAGMDPQEVLGKGIGGLKLALGIQAQMTVEDFKKMTRDEKTGLSLDDEMQKSLDAMDSIPPVILVPMMDAYIKGALSMVSAYEHGGWQAISDLYTNPPDSTEQVLHADKLYPKRDVPKKVTLASIKGYTDVYANTIGELEWRIYFNMWNKKDADKDSAGWDGDRFNVVKAADGTLVGLIATTWDSAAEAKEFATAYEKTVAVRFPNKERQVWIKTKGSHVFIVDGGTDAKLVDKLAKGTKIK